MLWAGRSVWHDRHVGIVEAAGSNPAPSTSFKIGKVKINLGMYFQLSSKLFFDG